LEHFGRVAYAKPDEPLKVPNIEGRQLRDAVNIHAGGQAGVMHLHALDVMRYEKPPPTVMDIPAVRQKLEISFDHTCDAIRFGGAQPKPVSIERAGRCIPELAEGL
jgi:glyoxylate carboligase